MADMFIDPCIRECTMDDVCKGCGRTQEEIDDWLSMSDEEMEAIMLRIKEGPVKGQEKS